ncbi:unnamed protein product, partial [Polarella glacialis]
VAAATTEEVIEAGRDLAQLKSLLSEQRLTRARILEATKQDSAGGKVPSQQLVLRRITALEQATAASVRAAEDFAEEATRRQSELDHLERETRTRLINASGALRAALKELKQQRPQRPASAAQSQGSETPTDVQWQDRKLHTTHRNLPHVACLHMGSHVLTAINGNA